MRKALVILTTLGALSTLAIAHPEEYKHHHEWWHHSEDYKHHDKFWCQQDWVRCKQFREEALKIKERKIQRERECLQKANSFWAFEECKAQVKWQGKREMYELRQRFMEDFSR